MTITVYKKKIYKTKIKVFSNIYTAILILDNNIYLIIVNEQIHCKNNLVDT